MMRPVIDPPGRPPGGRHRRPGRLAQLVRRLSLAIDRPTYPEGRIYR